MPNETPIQEASLTREAESTLRNMGTMIARLLKKATAPTRKTAQGLEDAATDTAKAKAVKGKTGQGMREAQLDEAGQNGLSFGEIGALLQDALRSRAGGCYVSLRDVFPTSVVYQIGWDGELWQADYGIDDSGAVVIGDARAVIAQTIYVPEGADLSAADCPYCGAPIDPDESTEAVIETPAAEASVELVSDLTPLTEAKRADGTFPVKLIAPGWGSSGFYSEEVLQRDGPEIFPIGTHMYLDHPTAAEEAERPERSVKDLASTLASKPRYETNGADGPGLYADALPIPGFDGLIEGLAPYTGLSIRADGTVKEGEAEGKRGRIVTSLIKGKSVDYVTRAGAGGKVLPLLESARAQQRATATPVPATIKESVVNEQEAKELRESIAELKVQNARLLERELLRDASVLAVKTLADIDLPVPTRARLAESLAKDPTVKDGALDRDAFVTKIKEAAASEATYLASLSESGKIVGMGNTAPVELTTEQAQAKLAESLQGLGLSESGAKLAAGR